MLIFIFALLIVVLILAVNYLPNFKKNKILLMSVLAISMIVINLINEIDILMFSKQKILIKSSTSVSSSYSHQYAERIVFSEEYSIKSMKNTQKYVTNLKNELKIIQQNQIQSPHYQISEENIRKSQQTINTITDNFDSINYPLTVSEKYFLQILKTKFIRLQDWIIQVQGLSNLRLEVLINGYLKDIRKKMESNQIQSSKKIQIASIYPQETVQDIAYFIPTLNPENFYYLIIYATPSPQIMKLLYSTYISKQKPLLTIIFKSETLPHEFNVFDISDYTEKYEFNEDYFLPLAELAIKHQSQQNSQIDVAKKNEIYLNSKLSTQQLLEICRKYVSITYEFYLRALLLNDLKNLSQLCYQHTQLTPSAQIECLKQLLTSDDDQISYRQAKQCWDGQIPQGVIITGNKIRLQKQYYWSKRISGTNFGLIPINSGNCTYQL